MIIDAHIYVIYIYIVIYNYLSDTKLLYVYSKILDFQAQNS